MNSPLRCPARMLQRSTAPTSPGRRRLSIPRCRELCVPLANRHGLPSTVQPPDFVQPFHNSGLLGWHPGFGSGLGSVAPAQFWRTAPWPDGTGFCLCQARGATPDCAFFPPICVPVPQGPALFRGAEPFCPLVHLSTDRPVEGHARVACRSFGSGRLAAGHQNGPRHGACLGLGTARPVASAPACRGIASVP